MLNVAWRIVREEGADALTLPRLSEAAGVAKPVVYDHFATRPRLLVALYEEYDAHHTAIMDAALAESAATLDDRATVIASSYVDCVLSQGHEITGVIAALAGSPELEKTRRDYQAVFMEKCRLALLPFAASGSIEPAGLRAMLGAADALSDAAAANEITAEQAKDELYETIVAMICRKRR